MSDYGWFALKGIGYLVLIGFAVWVTKSVLPILGLMMMPSWTTNGDGDQE